MAIMTLEIYGQSIKVLSQDNYGIACALEFCRSMIKYKMENVVDTSRPGYHAQMVRVPDCTYAASPLNRAFFCIHIGQRQEFLSYLQRCGISQDQIKIVEVPFYEAVKVEFKVKDGWIPKENQVPVIDYILDDDRLKILPIQTGFGKALTLDTPIRKPGGWYTMRDVEVGDVISGADGKPTNVIGVYPQGVEDVYELTFYDGRKVKASGEHLWKSFYVNTTKERQWGVRNTLELMRLMELHNPRVAIPLIEPESGPTVDLPIHPYLLGVLLGDGFLDLNVRYDKLDDEIFNLCKDMLPDGVAIKTIGNGMTRTFTHTHYQTGPNPMVRILTELGLYGTRSDTKFVPEQYMEGSIVQRIQLLQGLLDTDGTVAKGGTIVFTSTSKALAEAVQRLSWSLGGIARMSEKHPHYTYKGERREGKVAYNVYIRHKSPSILFRLERKKERTNDNNQYAEGLKLYIKSIELVGREETQCIAVDNQDKLFVCGDFIVTHNTFVALYAAAKLGLRWMLVTRGGYIDKWIEDVKKTYDIDDSRIIVIKGEKALMRAIDKARQGDFDYDVMLVSTGGLADYIKHYEQYLGTELGDLYLDPRALGMLFGIGMRVVDEAHQMLHMYYRIDLYSHFNKVLNLSATIIGNDAMEKRIHEIIYPTAKRFTGAEWKCYIVATALRYNLSEPHKARFKDHRKNYSHVVYEQYLMRNKEKLKNYLNMVGNLAYDFFKNRKPGQKYLIFASTVDMCNVMVADLKKRFPHLKVGRYVAEDNLEDIYGYDLTVTTPGSGGTGIDIPDLAAALATSSVSSGKLNIQMLGRLRELKNYPGEFPEYQYLVCSDIPKQVEYHKQKYELFQGKVKTHREQMTGASV